MERVTGTWAEYDRRKQEWLRLHPEATSEEIERANRKIAEDLEL